MLDLSQIRAWCYDIIRENEWDSNAYPVSMYNDFINNYYFNIITGWVVNIFSNEVVSKSKLPFAESEVFYNVRWQTYITTEIEVWDNTIEAITEWFPSAWNLYINWNIVTYTSKTPSAFEWVTWIKWTFTEWTTIQFLYSLPTDYFTTIDVSLNNLPITLKDYHKITQELKDYKYIPSEQYLTIIKWKYILANWVQNWQIQLKYEIKPTLLTGDEDLVIIPDDVYSQAIKYLSTWEMMYNRWEEARWKEVFLFWINRLTEMYNFYWKQMNKNINWTRIWTWRFNPYNF